MPHPTRDEVRERFLKAGVAVFLESLGERRSGERGLTHLDLKRVAAEAGYRSPGMIYFAWEDPESDVPPRARYEQDLLDRLLTEATSAALVRDDVDDNLDADATTDDAIRNVANAAFVDAVDSPGNAIFQLISTLAKDDPSRQRLAEAEAAETDVLAEVFEVGLAHYGRTLKDGVGLRDMAWILRSLEYGLSIRTGMCDGIDERPNRRWNGSEGWSLYAIAIHTLLMNLTDPVGEVEPN